MFDNVAEELGMPQDTGMNTDGVGDLSNRELLYQRTFSDALDPIPELITEETLAEFVPGLRELTAA